MDSTSNAQSSSGQFPAMEHSSYIDQRQILSLQDVNNEESTSHPTYHQHLPTQGYNPATGNTQSWALNPEKPVKRGRGWTGMPRGRPPGAKNKPKGPEYGLPKLPKKRGRPLGAKNKCPRGAHNASQFTDSSSSPVENGSPPKPTPIMVGSALLMPPSAPAEAETIYRVPDGYEPTTSSLSVTYPPPENLMTPMAFYNAPPTASSYANQSGYEERYYAHGFQYSPLPESNNAFYNENVIFSNDNSSNPFQSSSSLRGRISPSWDPTLPPMNLTEYTSPSYNSSSSVTDADSSLSKLRPRSSIAQNLGAEAQSKSPAPANPGPSDNDPVSLTTETEFDRMMKEIEESPATDSEWTGFEGIDTQALQRDLTDFE